MLEKVKNILKSKDILKPSSPKHIAITLGGVPLWAEKTKNPLEEAYRISARIIDEVIKEQVKQNIPVLTFYVLPEYLDKETEAFSKLLNLITSFFDNLPKEEWITTNKIKVSVLGKWYNLPGRAVEAIKKTMDATKDYDSFFVNFCINYNGQEEIVDACKLIARQVKAGKLDPDSINKSAIKESIYSSYFLPPDLLIKNGPKKRTSGLLLWDSSYTVIHFTDKLWPDFSKKDFLEVINQFKARIYV